MEDEIKIEGPLDINQALNEFQNKAVAEQATKTVVANQPEEVPLMIRLVIKLSGGTLDEIQASYVLFGFALLIILISVFVFFGGSFSAPNPANDQKMLLLHPDLIKK